MPELPEVETVRSTLEPNLINKKITDVVVQLPKLIKIPSGDKAMFKDILLGSSFTGIKRRGKYLLFYLNNRYVLVIHLRMTGRLLYEEGSKEIIKHTHFIFKLNNGYDLRFHDVRQFGLIYLVPEDQLEQISGLKTMGPEPLDDGFTLDCLKASLKNKNKMVKAFLLDQTCVAGIGNIYADEILFQAGIHPERSINTLTIAEQNNLWQAIRDRLAEGVKYRGTSIKDYVDGFGEAGGFQNQLKVYGKFAQPCPQCGTMLERLKVAGRSTAYCPKCQH